MTQLSCKYLSPAVELRDPGHKDLVAICKQCGADDRFTALLKAWHSCSYSAREKTQEAAHRCEPFPCLRSHLGFCKGALLSGLLGHTIPAHSGKASVQALSLLAFLLCSSFSWILPLCGSWAKPRFSCSCEAKSAPLWAASIKELTRCEDQRANSLHALVSSCLHRCSPYSFLCSV